MLREQVITPRHGGGRARGRGNEITQRPARRGSSNSSGTRASSRSAQKSFDWRKAVAWMPLVGKVLLAVCLGMMLFAGYRAASASKFFEVRTVDVSGVSHTSDEQIKAIVRRTVGVNGVWHADLGAISSELERQPWVRSAIVSRVLPSGLRVRIIERSPRAVVRTAAGRLMWVDDEGVTVGLLSPTDHMPAFFLRGWDETGTDAARGENRQRIEKFLEVTREWESAGLAARVSEVNLDDMRDVRVELAGNDSQIEIRLGKDDLTKRLTQALHVLDEERQTPRGALISYIDMTRGKGAVLGTRTQPLAPSAKLPGMNDSDVNANDANHSSTEERSTASLPAAHSNARPHATHDAQKRKPPRESPKHRDAQAENHAAVKSRGSIERPRRVGHD